MSSKRPETIPAESRLIKRVRTESRVVDGVMAVVFLNSEKVLWMKRSSWTFGVIGK